jgi:multicomponent Na+:H+ antiporter subunit B
VSEVPLEAVLFVFLLVVGIVVGRQRNLFGAAMLTGIFSLLSAGLFTLMTAVDVAFTEAAVGAGISTVLFLATLALTEDEEKPSERSWVAIGVVSLTALALLFGTADMPAFGDPGAPIHQGVGKHYLQQSWAEIGLPNVVTSVLASYRGYDTFGELVVVFTAGIGVVLLLRSKQAVMGEHEAPIPARSRAPYVREMPIVRALAKAILPFVLLFALYVQAHGDYGPGGGFQAGVIFAAGLVLYGLVWGPRALQRLVPERALETAMALGVLLYGGVGVATLLAGGTFLDYSALTPEHPQHGQHYGILLVELGVGVTVAAVMLMIYFVFTARPRRKERTARFTGHPGPAAEAQPKQREPVPAPETER